MNLKNAWERIKLERDISETQGFIYRQAALDGCEMSKFSFLYLNCNFCKKRMESVYSTFQREDAQTCLEFIYPEIKIKPDNLSDSIFNPDIAYWIGYTYYQLYCETGIHGYEIAEKLSFNTMCKHYAWHHVMDEIYSTDDLCNIYGFKKDEFHVSFSNML